MVITKMLIRHDSGVRTAEGDGGQATPLQRRGPLAPDPVAGGIGDPLQGGHRQRELFVISFPGHARRQIVVNK